MHTVNPRTFHTAIVLLLFVFGVITMGFMLLGGNADGIAEEIHRGDDGVQMQKKSDANMDFRYVVKRK